jgi:hypothetical protein
MEQHGRRLQLSISRRLIGELAYFAGKVPSMAVQRRMELARVVAARQQAAPRPGWCALFTKAYAIVSARRPELRQAYFGFPWPHLYEHPINVASVGIDRPEGDASAVVFGQIARPESLSLVEVEALIRRYKEEPIETNVPFCRMLNKSRLPRPLRRLLWWHTLSSSGRRRAATLGTFSITTVGGFGAAIFHPHSPLTTTLSYGIIAADSAVDVSLTFDPRVLDAATAAHALGELEDVLNHDIIRELGYLRGLDAA